MMTSPNQPNHMLKIDFANHALKDLYARRDAVDKLIRSLEAYQSSAKSENSVRFVRTR